MTAPNFTLKNTKKEDVSLSDFKGKTVVLAFYPGAFTGVCDTEMCKLKEDMEVFNSMDAVVLGISVDSPWANGAFADKYDLDFDLLSDLHKQPLKIMMFYLKVWEVLKDILAQIEQFLSLILKAQLNIVGLQSQIRE